MTRGVDGSMIGSARSSVSLSMCVSLHPTPPNSIIAVARFCSPHHAFPSIYKRIETFIYLLIYIQYEQQRMNFDFFVRLILEIHVIIY